jgi:hypothetical protein
MRIRRVPGVAPAGGTPKEVQLRIWLASSKTLPPGIGWSGIPASLTSVPSATEMAFFIPGTTSVLPSGDNTGDDMAPVPQSSRSGVSLWGAGLPHGWVADRLRLVPDSELVPAMQVGVLGRLLGVELLARRDVDHDDPKPAFGNPAPQSGLGVVR